ncbi:MAG: DUF4412 domain-containing protein [Bacteroidota bacterium]
MNKKIFTLAVAAVTIMIGSVAYTPGDVAGFEGTIEFKQQSASDTTNRVYYVKGDKVRIDEIGSKSKKPEGSFIVDLKASTMTFLSHDRKLYGDQATGGTPNKPTGTCTVTKGKGTKTIAGYKCTEYIVKNKDENTQIAFYLASGKFDFFSKLLTVLNRKDKFATYYQQLTNVNGMFPMLAVMSPMDGKEKERMEVTKVEKKTVDASQFDVPKDYLKFEK